MAINPINSDHISPSENSINTAQSLKKAQRSSSASPLSKFQTNTGDPVNFSDEREEYEVIQDAIKLIPDIRQEKIKQIRKALESRQYQVPSEDIADRIIQDTITNRPRSQS